MNSSKIALVLVMSVAAAIAAPAQVQVVVPGNASGHFGNVADLTVPFVPALTVDGPGTITVTYVSGMVDWGGGHFVGPNGGSVIKNDSNQSPLQEAQGIAPHGIIDKVGALIGVFVRKSRVDHPAFQAIDGTKNATTIGIMPGRLFFIGDSITFDVTEAGTLFLGINDWIVRDNSGGFTVAVTGP